MQILHRSPLRVAFVALTIAVLGVAASAMPGRGGDGRLDARIERLDLDAETQSRVDAVLDDTRSEKRTLRRELRAAHDAQRELLRSAEADEAALFAAVDRVVEAQRALGRHRVQLHLALRDVLSAEQLDELMAHGRGRFARAER